MDYALRRQKIKSRHYERPRPVMNVTPLVDVVLVLLIIFMVVIPALQQGLNIEITGIKNPDEASESKNQPLILSVTREHDLYLEEEQVAPKDLEAKLRAASRAQPGRRVVVRADKYADYTRVREIYRVAQNCGFPGVSLRVNKVQDDDKQ
jgi:biopolymer transport protein TolR